MRMIVRSYVWSSDSEHFCIQIKFRKSSKTLLIVNYCEIANSGLRITFFVIQVRNSTRQNHAAIV